MGESEIGGLPPEPPLQVEPVVKALEPPVEEPVVEEFEKPLEGHFVDVVDGPHKGLYAAFLKVIEKDEHGNPVTIPIRNRDHEKDVDLAAVAFKDCRPSTRTGGR